MPEDLKDRVIIITGASAGIGAATAVRCAAAGMDVVLTARRADRLEDVAGQVRTHGRKAAIVPGDVADPRLSRQLIDEAMTRFGRFDAVFANAGYGLEKPVIHTSDEELRRIFDVNFFSGVELLRLAAARLLEQKRPGHLLMCSSAVAKFTLPYYGAYSATKAAQNMVCRAMRLELEPHGIEVSSVHPVSTRTEFSEVVTQLSHPDGADGNVAPHSPEMFVQSADRVARAVVRCLRRPKPEVWTSFTARFGAAVLTLWPGYSDVVMRRLRRVIEKQRPDLRSPMDRKP
jgi:short-subunit dehydrogenase